MTRKCHTNKLIVIEGIDGSGKTTVARALARRLPGKYLKTPPPPFAPMRRYIDRVASLPTRFLFYLCAVAHASDLIKDALETSHVICDRYVASTVACHKALGLTMHWPLPDLHLVSPDYSFLLTVTDEHERLRRLRTRGRRTAADRIFEVVQLRNRLTREYTRFAFVTIDTTHLTPAQVVDEILRRVDP